MCDSIGTFCANFKRLHWLFRIMNNATEDWNSFLRLDEWNSFLLLEDWNSFLRLEDWNSFLSLEEMLLLN